MRKGLGMLVRSRLGATALSVSLIPTATVAVQPLMLQKAATASPAKTATAAPAKAAETKQCETEPAWYAAARRRAAERKAVGKPVKVIRTGATWYGPGFHGRRTASGERFNQNAMTLASRHLPFGTRVRVVNPKTGKSAVGRVNDRGPFGKKGYTADLSKGMAQRIGLQGSGQVRLEVLGKAAK